MGGSTNTVLHLLAAAQEAELDFTMADIDEVSRRVPCVCKVAPNGHYLMEDVHRAGGIPAILGELHRGGLLHDGVADRPFADAAGWLDEWDIRGGTDRRRGDRALPRRARAASARRPRSRRPSAGRPWTSTRPTAACATSSTPTPRRRPGDPVRQHRGGRLRGEDGGRRRVDLEVLRAGASWSSPRRRRSTLILGEQRQAGRRGGHPLRGPEGRTRHAGDALPDLLPQGPGARRGVRAAHRRALLGRHVGAVDRPRLARGGQPAARSRWSRTATPSSSTSRAGRSRWTSPTPSSRTAARAGGYHRLPPAEDRPRAVTPALRAYAAMATSADKGAVRDVSRIEALQDAASRADQPA